MKGRCQRYHRGSLNSVRAFLFFGPKIFSSISRFVEVAQVKGRCQRYHRGSLNSLCAFSFFGPKNISLISRFVEVAQVKKRCQRYHRGSLNSVRAYLFFGPKNISFDISISGGRTGERKVSTVPSRFPEQCARIFVFRSKNISLISRFLEVAQVKGRCQRYHRGSLNSVRAFSFFGPKNFFDFDSGGRTGDLPSRFPEQLRAWIFWSKNIYTGERKLSTVPSRFF